MGLIKSTEGFSIANMMNDFNQAYGVNCSGFTPNFNGFNYKTPDSCFSTNSLPQLNFETNNNIWNNWTIPTPNNIFANNLNSANNFNEFKAFNTTPTIQPPSFKFDFNEYQIGTFYSNRVAQTTASTSSTNATSKNDIKETYTYNNSNDKYADKNAKYLKNLSPEMRERTEKLIAYANKNGYDVEIISGKRTQQEQEALRKKYANQPGRVAKKSAHVEGLAIDIRVYKNGVKAENGYTLLGNYAKSNLGMRWGGDFKSFKENWHFDYNWA